MFGGVIVDDSTLLTSSIAGVRAGRKGTDGAGVEHGSISNSRCEYVVGGGVLWPERDVGGRGRRRVLSTSNLLGLEHALFLAPYGRPMPE